MAIIRKSALADDIGRAIATWLDTMVTEEKIPTVDALPVEDVNRIADDLVKMFKASVKTMLDTEMEKVMKNIDQAL
jgi:hypothetical protein